MHPTHSAHSDTTTSGKHPGYEGTKKTNSTHPGLAPILPGQMEPLTSLWVSWGAGGVTRDGLSSPLSRSCQLKRWGCAFVEPRSSSTHH